MLAINTYDEFGIPASTNVGRFQFSRGSRPSGGRGRPETQAWLPEAGLFYYKARMYSPTLGRFLQTDPIGYADGLNWYNYVGGDPINSVDPLGTSGCNQVAPNLYVCGNIAIRTSPNSDGTLSFTTSNGQSGVFNPTTGIGSVDIVVTGNRGGGANLGGSSNLQGSVPSVSGPATSGVVATVTVTPGQETPDTEEENKKDIAICNSLSNAGARSRCFESANARDYARRWNRPIPPLITWRTAAPGVQPRTPNPWAVGGVLAVGGAIACAIAEPCGAAVVGALGLGGLGILATQ